MGWNDEIPKKGWDIIDTKPTLAEQLKEQNAVVDKLIKETANVIITGIDQGSADGDTTIVSLHHNGIMTVIGESIELSIPIGWNNKTVKAIRVGDLAIHDDIDDANCWQITHVPTLTRFDNAVPDGDFTQEQLCMWCWKVQQNYPDDFKYLNTFDNSNYKTAIKLMLEKIKEHCLSIGVE